MNYIIEIITTNQIIDGVLAMTWYNPLFAFTLIICLWFVPGIIVRKIVDKRYLKSKADKQAKEIERLYPKK